MSLPRTAVPHISLVFREMWDTTALSLRLFTGHYEGVREAEEKQQVPPLRYALSKKISRKGPRNCRSLRYATPDFLWTLVALADLMRLSLRERRTRGFVQSCVAGNPGTLRSELVTFLIWPVVCGWKAGKSICQQHRRGSFGRLRTGSSTARHKPSVMR